MHQCVQLSPLYTLSPKHAACICLSVPPPLYNSLQPLLCLYLAFPAFAAQDKPTDSPPRPKKSVRHAKFADVEDTGHEGVGNKAVPRSRPGSFIAKSRASSASGKSVGGSRAASFSASRPGTSGEGHVKRR